MSDRYVTLLGTEDVSRAASTMARAAQSMQDAAGAMESSLERHRRFLDEWLDRLERVYAARAAIEGAA